MTESTRVVNFILLGSELNPDYQRAIRSARVHDAPIILWYTGRTVPNVAGLGDVRTIPIGTPEFAIAPAHLWDLLAYQVGCMGGLVLGLDTISLRPAWDLLGAHEVVVSTDWPDEDLYARPDPYNNNFLAKTGAIEMQRMRKEALLRVKMLEEKWGYTGPLMLTPFVKAGIIKAAPFPALCGWGPGWLWKFYLGLERPHPDTRVIHLCRTAYIDLCERRYDAWAAANPGYAYWVGQRTDLNDDILAL